VLLDISSPVSIHDSQYVGITGHSAKVTASLVGFLHKLINSDDRPVASTPDVMGKPKREQ
jgi:hypothetical protein